MSSAQYAERGGEPGRARRSDDLAHGEGAERRLDAVERVGEDELQPRAGRARFLAQAFERRRLGGRRALARRSLSPAERRSSSCRRAPGDAGRCSRRPARACRARRRRVRWRRRARPAPRGSRISPVAKTMPGSREKAWQRAASVRPSPAERAFSSERRPICKSEMRRFQEWTRPLRRLSQSLARRAATKRVTASRTVCPIP